MDGEALTRTIELYNQYAESGVDEEFGRGTSELNRFNGDLANKPNPCLRKIGPGPYYAVAVWPSDLASSAGLRTDSRGRVLRSDGGAFKGLYAAGTDAASIFRGTYPGPGTMIDVCLWTKLPIRNAGCSVAIEDRPDVTRPVQLGPD
jgi:predicted oxidoreductase